MKFRIASKDGLSILGSFFKKKDAVSDLRTFRSYNPKESGGYEVQKNIAPTSNDWPCWVST